MNNISVSIKRYNFTLAFLKTACHANPGAERNFYRIKFIYFKTHIFVKVLNASVNDNVLLLTNKS